jgi:hypothetical protein
MHNLGAFVRKLFQSISTLRLLHFLIFAPILVITIIYAVRQHGKFDFLEIVLFYHILDFKLQ